MRMHQILKISLADYKDILWSTKFDWFKTYNHTYQDLQIAITNQKLHNYYDKKYQELENHFLNQIRFFEAPKTPHEMIDLYIDVTNEIFRTYPRALEEKLTVKQKIVQPLFN